VATFTLVKELTQLRAFMVIKVANKKGPDESPGLALTQQKINS
jgi:hypothetical protein